MRSARKSLEDVTFELEIRCENAAFHDDDETEGEDGEDDGNGQACRSEVARILREIAEHLDNGRDGGKCMDANGNSVGEWGLG